MNALLLLGETIVVIISAWLIWRAGATGPRDLLEELLGWGVLFFLNLAAVGVVLGATGHLSHAGFVAGQMLTLLVLLLLRRRQLSADGRAAAALLRAVAAAAAKDRPTYYLTVGLGLFLAVTGVLAALAEPVVYDALTYRLSRIGQWLQDGRVAHFATNDPRQNYMPDVPDLVMTWLVSAFPAGFRAAALAQWGGGWLLLLATAGLARLAGLGRPAALASAWLVAGTANVAPQFTTLHTDLFTAGLLAAAYYLWHKAALRGEGSWVAGLGGGLALGAKGTVLYLGPTLLLWAIWAGWQWRLSAAAWSRTLLAIFVATLVFAVPGFMKNWRTYGGPLGPPEFVSLHHKGAGGKPLYKLGLNLGSSFAQVFEPNSQPPGLQAAGRSVGDWLGAGLPVQDPFSFDNLNRRETIRSINARLEPDADTTSFGLPFLGLFLLGAGFALRSSRAGAIDIRRWCAGLLLFFIFFHALQQWHPFGFRYFVLVAPWMAVVAAWGLAGLSRRIGLVVWGLALVASAATAWQVLAHTYQAGWRAVAEPERSRNYFVYHGWREWSGGLGRASEPLQVALPVNRPLAAFYRLPVPRIIRPRAEGTLAGLTAEQAVAKTGEGWLIVPALEFMGNEGRVSARVWLYDGDPASPFSLAAYHQVSAATPEETFVYRHRIFSTADQTRHELLVRTGPGGKVIVHCEAAVGEGWRYTLTSPSEESQGAWPGGEHEFSLPLPAGKVAEVVVIFQPAGAAPPGSSPPTLEIRP